MVNLVKPAFYTQAFFFHQSMSVHVSLCVCVCVCRFVCLYTCVCLCGWVLVSLYINKLWTGETSLNYYVMYNSKNGSKSTRNITSNLKLHFIWNVREFEYIFKWSLTLKMKLKLSLSLQIVAGLEFIKLIIISQTQYVTWFKYTLHV